MAFGPKFRGDRSSIEAESRGKRSGRLIERVFPANAGELKFTLRPYEEWGYITTFLNNQFFIKQMLHIVLVEKIVHW